MSAATPRGTSTARAAAAVGVAIGAAAVVVGPEAAGRGDLWAFLLAAVLGELIVLEGLRRTAPTSVAVLAAYALLGHGPLETTGVAVAAWVVAGVLGLVRGERPRPVAVGERALAAWTLAGLAGLGGHVLPRLSVGADDVGIGVVATTAVIGGLILGPAVWERLTAPAPGSLASGVVRGSGVAVALGASAALVAVAYGLLGAGALLLLLPPVLAVRAGLRRYVDIRRTYDQTVVAMSRMTELTGHAEPGHGVRVAELAAAVGLELGLGDRGVLVLERAGHLHELGRVVTDDPERAARDREVAVAGAAIVREAGGMDGVADVIERHRDPYVGADHPDRSLPLASRIVHTACEFDRLAGGSAPDRHPAAAVATLREGRAHDPRVVRALERVLAGRTGPAGVDRPDGRAPAGTS